MEDTTMTKKEIYEQVVRLTTELAETGVTKKIFDAVTKGDTIRIDGILDAFPAYYPELYVRIVKFCSKFKEFVGDSLKDERERNDIVQECGVMMFSLAESKIMSKIAEAEETGDAQKVLDVIRTFKNEEPGFAKNLLKFQESYNKYRDNCKTGHEGNIFGIEADEENGIYAFDTNVIDALSFYLLTIMMNTSDLFFFYTVKVEEDGETYYTTANDKFIEAIEEATNQDFAEFVACYNIVDWVDTEAGQTIGEILCTAYAGEFEEEVE